MNLEAPLGSHLSELPEQITLYATSESERIRHLLAELFRAEDLEVTEPYPDVLRVSCKSSALAEMSATFASALRPAEFELIRCRWAPAETELSLAELMHSKSLRGLMAWIDGMWLGRLMASRRLLTYYQPIVNSQHPEQAFAYECLMRGIDEDGRLIPPDRLLAAARATGMLPLLDEAARLTAIESAAKARLETNVFINFNPKFIDQSLRSLKQTIQATEASGVPADRFVFEVVESDEIVDYDQLLQVLDYCRDAGCRVALDDLGAGYSSLNMMAIVKPDFVKLDMGLIRDVDKDMYKSCVASKLLELAHELGVATVVEGVETPDEWEWARQHGAEYAQGFLFARPAPIPPVPQCPEPPSPHGAALKTACEHASEPDRRVPTVSDAV